MKNQYCICILIVLLGCQRNHIDIIYVKSIEWQYENGYKVGMGDFMDFTNENTGFKIVNDTIYFLNEPNAIILSVKKRSRELIVRSFDGRKGKYISMH